MIPAAEKLVNHLPKHVKALLTDVYKLIVDKHGCHPDVKTIYISFTFEQAMVASAHIGTEDIELALALPEDHPSNLMEDALHLTWRTLPVLLRVNRHSTGKDVLELVEEAVERVKSGRHAVNRPPEFFANRKRK